MKIAYISSEYSGLPNSGGIGTYFEQAAICMARLGHIVEVFTSGKRGSLRETSNIRYHQLDSQHPQIFSVEAAKAFSKRHSEVSFDVIEYAEHRAEGLIATELTPSVARVVRIHSPSIILDRYLDFPRKKRELFSYHINQFLQIGGAAKHRLPIPSFKFEPYISQWGSGADHNERYAASSADLVIVMSNEMREFVKRHWWIDQEKIFKIPNPLDIGNPRHLHRESATKSTYKIGFAGRFEPRKGLVPLAKALRCILPSHKDWQAEIVGRDCPSCLSGRSSLDISRQIVAPMADRVCFMNPIDHNEIPEWLASLDIFVLPSLWDNFPYAVIEAMATGCAIIASNTGAVSEMLNGSGILVNPGNERELAKALKRLIMNADLRTTYGRGARSRFDELYSSQVIASQMEDGYHQAIAKASMRQQQYCDAL